MGIVVPRWAQHKVLTNNNITDRCTLPSAFSFMLVHEKNVITCSRYAHRRTMLMKMSKPALKLGKVELSIGATLGATSIYISVVFPIASCPNPITMLVMRVQTYPVC